MVLLQQRHGPEGPTTLVTAMVWAWFQRREQASLSEAPERVCQLARAWWMPEARIAAWNLPRQVESPMNRLACPC